MEGRHIGALHRGDHLDEEIAQWVNRHGDAVVRYLTLRLADADLAQDLAQETFARLYLFRRRHPDRRITPAWLYKVAGRLVVDHWRSVQARPRVQWADDRDREPGGEEDPAAAIVRRQQIAEILFRMPPRERECLVLFYWEDWPLDAIARELGCSPVTVRVRLHRARERFRRLWRVEEEVGSDGPRP